MLFLHGWVASDAWLIVLTVTFLQHLKNSLDCDIYITLRMILNCIENSS